MKAKMKAGYIVGLLISSIAGYATASPVQWRGLDGGNDHWYDIVVSDIYYYDAKAVAVTMGGYLATPDLPGEASFIFDNLVAPTANGTFQGYWLGAYYPGPGSVYQWVTGGAVTAWEGTTYIDWAGGDVPQGIAQFPNNWWTSGVALQDQPLIYPAAGFVLEFVNPSSQIPVPSTIWLFGLGLGVLRFLYNRNIT